MAATLLVLYHHPTDPTAFERYYHGTHIPLAKKMPGIRKYTVNKGPVAGAGGESPYFLVAELAFDSMAALGAAFESAEGKAAAGDVPNFATGGVTMVTYETTEV